ncbi:MAG: amino acid transporter, partial [Chloroflexota bacterium]|nr:amino acid transporter [Chloroflexota bacterium]
SRLWRQTELRVGKVVLDGTAQRFVREAARGEIRIIAHDTDTHTTDEYAAKEAEQRRCSHIPAEAPVLFLEVTVPDASEFAPDLVVTGHTVGPHRVLRARSAAVPNAIAAFLLYVRNTTGKVPHAYFEWSEGNPLGHLARYVLFGEGDIAPVTHEVLREAEPMPERRPTCHVA